MATVDELKVKITADTSQYEKSISRVKSSLNGLSKAIGTAFSITALAAFTRSCLKAASDLEEVQNVVEVSFGKMSKEVDAFASNAIKAFGITELQAKQVASTFMAMSNAMGLPKERARDMSLALTGLAADMASFYNTSLNTAQTALEGIFTGQTRALRQFGVILDETTLEEYRLSEGIQKAYNAMTQAEKATLRYNYTMKALAQAQGDYARTTNSWANQVRLLTNQFNQLKVAIGQILRGLFGPLLTLLNAILARLVRIAQAIAALFGKQTENNAAALSTEIEGIGAGFDDANVSAKALQKTLGGFDELNRLQPKAEETGGGGGVGGISIEPLDWDFEGLDKATDSVESIKESFESLVPILEKIKDLLIAGIIVGGILALPGVINNISGVLSKFGDKIWNGLVTAAAWLGNFPNLLKNAFTNLGGVFAKIGESIKLLFAGGSESIASTLGIFAAIAAGVAALVGRFRELWNSDEQGEAFQARVNGVLETLQNGFRRVIAAFGPLWECLQNLFKTVQALWKDCFKPVFDAIADIVISVSLNIGEALGNLMAGPLGDLIAIVIDFASIVVDTVNIILQAISPAIQSITGAWLPLVSAAIQGLFDLITIGVNWVVNAISVFSNAWKTAFDTVHNFVHKMAESITTAFGNIRQGIKDAINSAIYWIETGINNIINRINNSGIVTAINRFTGWSIGISPIYIPRLASGGVINSPTVAMMGEYAGAAHNPEIVAPQNILKETIDASNGELASVFAQGIRQLLQAIEAKDLEVSIGDTTIAKSAARGNRQYQLATGTSLF